MGHRVRGSDIEIECAIARGESVPFICQRLNVPATEVERVWQGMDELNREPAAVPKPHRPKPQTTHGTYGGYRQHQRRRTVPCLECCAAYSRYRSTEREAAS